MIPATSVKSFPCLASLFLSHPLGLVLLYTIDTSTTYAHIRSWNLIATTYAQVYIISPTMIHSYTFMMYVARCYKIGEELQRFWQNMAHSGRMILLAPKAWTYKIQCLSKMSRAASSVVPDFKTSHLLHAMNCHRLP